MRPEKIAQQPLNNMLSFLVNNHYCYNYLLDQIPVSLLLYSHIPTALVALLFGGYVFFRVRDLPSTNLFIVCIAFAVWCFLDLASWFAFLGAQITMFTWSLVDLFALIFFFFTYYFLYSFTTKRDLPVWQKIGGLILLLPTAIVTLLGLNLTSFDGNNCDAIENDLIAKYPYVVEGIFILAVIIFAIYQYRKFTTKDERRETLLASVGVGIFLTFFFLATFSVNLLVNYDISQYAYNFEIYGLFGMPILLIYLGYLIVRYKAFDIKVFGAQALIVFLVALVAAQFFFLQGFSSFMLNIATLLLIATFGNSLIRSVKNEIKQKEVIAATNKQLENLLHFISHEVKGALNKTRITLSEILDETNGVLSPELKSIALTADSDTKRAVDMVMNILGSADFKSGKIATTKATFDFKAALLESAVALTPDAQAKGLSIEMTVADKDTAGRPVTYTVLGDREQLTKHVLRNLIDNSIKYTPTGGLKIGLEKKGSGTGAKFLLSIKDTGVGITPEDMKRLFTEGGKGEHSTDVNVHSTGYGLYFAKSIVEAHGGRVWAESAGAGKGSQFYVELPEASGGVAPVAASVADPALDVKA